MENPFVHSCLIATAITLSIAVILLLGSGLNQINGQNLSLKNCELYINNSQTLKNSMDCDFTNGLIINSNNVNLNLNNAAIMGAGYLNHYTGILISNKSNITLQGDGIVGHFGTGLLIENSTNIDVSSVNFTGNDVSILVKNSSNIKIENDSLYTNTAGVKFYNIHGSSISSNYFESNDISAISLFFSDNNTLSNNSISSSLNGIYIDPKSTNITTDSNQFYRSFGVDINLGNGGKFNQLPNQIFNNSCHITIPELLCK